MCFVARLIDSCNFDGVFLQVQVTFYHKMDEKIKNEIIKIDLRTSTNINNYIHLLHDFDSLRKTWDYWLQEKKKIQKSNVKM